MANSNNHDRGSEFIGADFQKMIKNDYGIKGKPITVKNPQANAIVERVHQTIGNIVRTFDLENNYLDEEIPGKESPVQQHLPSDQPSTQP
jgi:transposase InsO family protein